MFSRAISHLMKLYALVQLKMETLSGSAVRWMEGCIVAIGTASPTDLTVSVRAGESCVQHYLLQTLAIFPLEISDKGVIPLAIGETVFLKSLGHIMQIYSYFLIFVDMKRISAVFFSLLLALSMAGQEKRMAVVEYSAIYMRQSPDYESSLETQELMGTIVEIIGEQRYWRKIDSPQPYQAWATEKGLIELTPEELQAYVQAPKVMFMEAFGFIYEKASEKSGIICDLVGGDIMRTTLSASGKIRSKGGWTEVMLPSGRKGYVRSGKLRIHHGFKNIGIGEGNSGSVNPQESEAIIQTAKTLTGSPYLWGGMSFKGTDCSGLVRLVYLMNGYLLPRNASQQLKCGDVVEMDPKAELPERIGNLERGDLIFFGTPATEEGKLPRVTHIGIYLGEGMFIHSSQVVRINSLLPGSEAYYENSHRLVAARRL